MARNAIVVDSVLLTMKYVNMAPTLSISARPRIKVNEIIVLVMAERK
jgi:hypothetical protein